MKNKKVKSIKKIFFFLGLLFLISPLLAKNVQALDFGDGNGGDITDPTYATWQVKEGNNPAPFNSWKNTVWSTAYRNGSRYRDTPWIKDRLSQIGVGAKRADGSYESLYDTCTRSDYIWWYAAGPKDPKPLGYWYTFTEGSNYIPASNWQSMSVKASASLKYYKAQSKDWKKGKVILICSASTIAPEPVDIPITVQAKSGTFTYDGKKKTVSGYTTTSGKLESGHKMTVDSERSATNVGSYAVPVSKVKITDKNNNNVTKRYKITTKQGAMRINPVPTITGDDKQCVSPLSASTSAYVYNKTTGSHGYTPDGVGTLNKIEIGNWTAAGNHANTTGIPSVGSTITSWEEWKKKFESGSNNSTPTIDLEAGGVSATLSTHGGVYNVMRTLRKDTYSIESCQPQKRVKETKTKTEYTEVITKNPDGSTTKTKVPHEYKYQVWGPWKNDGVRKITKYSGPTTKYEYSNYQILSVNCNIDGFNNIKNSIGGEVIAIGAGDGAASLKTPTKEGTTTGELGKSGQTRNSSFYTDGESCEKVFKCTVAPNSGLSNDAKNNKGNANLFGEVLPGNKVGDANENGELIFFRDNEERQVRADLWYPKPTGKSDLDSHSGQPAKETFLKLYGDKTPGQSDPTPEIELTTIAPWDPASKRNKGISALDTIEKQTGEVNRFNMKSQWASNEGAPYQLGVNWEYKATGKNKIPSKVDGYDVKSNKEYSHDFDVYCDFRNGSSEYDAKIPDTPYANGLVSPNWSASDAIRTLFSRSASNMD